MEKKKYLDFLYYKVGRQQQDFELCFIKNEGDERKSTKWKKYSEIVFKCYFEGSCDDYKIKWFFDNCNQRQILKNEVVLDLENKNEFQEILNKLIKEDLYFSCYETGSKGMHFHLFFNRNLSSKEKGVVIRYFNCDMQKNSDRTMIALEFEKHWKSGNPKKLIKDNLNNLGDVGYNKLIVSNRGSDLIPDIVYDIKKSNKRYNGNS